MARTKTVHRKGIPTMSKIYYSIAAVLLIYLFLRLLGLTP